VDINLFMAPLITVLAIAAIVDLGLTVVRRVLSGAVEGERDADD